jgi:hypothetical protein
LSHQLVGNRLNWRYIAISLIDRVAMLKLGRGQGPVKKSDFSDALNRKPVVTTYRKDERYKFLATCKGVQIII